MTEGGRAGIREEGAEGVIGETTSWGGGGEGWGCCCPGETEARGPGEEWALQGAFVSEAVKRDAVDEAREDSVTSPRDVASELCAAIDGDEAVYAQGGAGAGKGSVARRVSI